MKDPNLISMMSMKGYLMILETMHRLLWQWLLEGLMKISCEQR